MNPSLSPSRFCCKAAAAALWLFLLAPASHAAGGPITIGNARFTVVTPLCIRMEYAATGKFVDEPSLFAAGRGAHFEGFRLMQVGGKTVIDTGVIRLTYTPDGRPFSPANLTAVVHKGAVTANWVPSAANPGNLGGTTFGPSLRALDGADGPKELTPGLLSRDGWFLLDDSKTPLLTTDWVKSRPADAGSDWYLFGYGDDYKGALKSMTTIGGPIPMPRKYLLGAWYSRYWPYSSADYHQIVAEYAAHDFPLDNIVLDMDWHKDGWSGWSWNRKLLPDAEQLLPWFHSQGLHESLNLHPDDGVGPQEDQYAAFMRDVGADPAAGRTLPFDAGGKKYMDALFKDVLDPLKSEGVDFWWLDWWQANPDARSVPGLSNLFWLNTLLFNETAQGGQRGVSFSRWAGWGDHRHPIHFSGDASTSFSMLAFEVPFTSTAGNVGCFFWSHDIGGFTRGRNEESYTRWAQFGATSAALRSHSTRDPNMDRRPWLYPQWATDSMRISFHLRDQLFPYIYSSVQESTQNTIPLNRPMYLEYPDTEAAYHQAQQYFYGDDILAAPIVTPGVGPGHVAHQTVWFPPSANWYNYFSGEEYSGGASALVSADINEFPLYFKGGVPIPMQPYTPRMASTPLTTLVVRAYPGSDGKTGRFTLYEDDGQTTAYQHGASATTPLTYVRHGNTIAVTIGAERGRYTGQPIQRGAIVELPDTGRATKVMINGKPAAATYDAGLEMNRVIVPAHSIRQTTTVVVQAAPGDVQRLRAAAFARRVTGVSGPINDHGTVSIQPILAAALKQTTDPAQRDEILAAAGIGLVAHNMAPYLYNGAMQYQFFAPPGLVDGDKVALQSGRSVSIPAHGPANTSGASRTHRRRTITEAEPLTFTIGGQKIQQSIAGEKVDELFTDANVAGTSQVTASGSEIGYTPEGAVDGIVGGYPGDTTQEWSAGAATGAWLQLHWDAPQTVDRIVLYDRPNTTDQITSGTLTFSDGSALSVGALPDDAKTGLTVTFPAKTITWVKFTVNGVKPGTQNAGLSEIGVFRANR